MTVNLWVNRYSICNCITHSALDFLLAVSTSYSNRKLVVYQLKTVDNGSKFLVGHFTWPISLIFSYIF
ncbi:hypothetical protein CXF93_02025 [Moritella sp. Urea-trap-13]|nr:hypothetical protein CXF93_02025 [Moritella sp. Urea-trap-13]